MRHQLADNVTMRKSWITLYKAQGACFYGLSNISQSCAIFIDYSHLCTAPWRRFYTVNSPTTWVTICVTEDQQYQRPTKNTLRQNPTKTPWGILTGTNRGGNQFKDETSDLLLWYHQLNKGNLETPTLSNSGSKPSWNSSNFSIFHIAIYEPTGVESRVTIKKTMCWQHSTLADGEQASQKVQSSKVKFGDGLITK